MFFTWDFKEYFSISRTNVQKHSVIKLQYLSHGNATVLFLSLLGQQL